MRISDWSSDVCSSDLQRRQQQVIHVARLRGAGGTPPRALCACGGDIRKNGGAARPPALVGAASAASSSPTRAKLLSSRKRSEEHTSELQSLMRISYAVFCLKKKNRIHHKDRNR